ncbi:putative transmembrane protein [Mycolicibacterium phlei]|jgi:hypothetical protein|uniref:Transmembrane protein n=1 Tax=Mycolicibacterium phlei DSM 43239 = CCUG 21000 TaxID=1226750 RepID=A0A5N5V7T7_MYCPH|nr:hypothetical protein [Mycolicibacterium phlei]VEG08517.1 putative transmembrane protein [Mycobacteroides chelonae]AMO60397.1 hypothetical protein MPHLCCUG_01573 [Mycolicibacterium phlei]EID17719.1 hypothetical protein MPHLEI_02608 [Mycolicibacterium phlei RIVM601174]KAB7756569.1 hypothetical protein MPHL21000_10865 [Mycolicibacterium phlei DSM 43239 = CCUG 21000]KXW61997.1 hypothetical protein MPHL43072_10005 [Mycolicibacterium phlei DSM 43072]
MKETGFMYDVPVRGDNQLRGVRDAVRFALGAAAAGGVLLFTAVLWVGTCQGATDDALACGAPQRTLLALSAPAVPALGGLCALHRSRRGGQPAWAWQGAGLFLLTSTVLVLTASLPPLTGSTVIG